jgi:DNA invertase Pin-like site-specific DNA recombinase
MAEGKFIAYHRVSTEKQGRSGLGLEAQREAVERYLNGGGWQLLAEYTEIETGKGANALDKRPQLRAALDHARKAKATLVIAKLDRLARNVHFISGLIEQRVPIVAADMPDADITMLQIYAVMAEREARVIGERTKAALAAAKARGTALGTHGKVLAKKHQAEAYDRLAPVADVLRALKGGGLSVRSIAATLNERGVASPGGGRWHLANTHAALRRLQAAVETPSPTADPDVVAGVDV